jgi:hypothetical protein
MANISDTKMKRLAFIENIDLNVIEKVSDR